MAGTGEQRMVGLILLLDRAVVVEQCLGTVAATLHVVWSRAWDICHRDSDFEWGRVFSEEMEVLCTTQAVSLENVCLAGDLIFQGMRYRFSV